MLTVSRASLLLGRVSGKCIQMAAAGLAFSEGKGRHNQRAAKQRSWITALAGSAVVLAATACSGPTINGFAITAGPSTVNINPGGTNYVTVAATSSNTTPITAALVVYNLPVGVSISPSSPTVTTGEGSQTSLTVTAAPNAPAGTTQVQISGYAGLAYSSAYVTVTVVPNN